MYCSDIHCNIIYINFDVDRKLIILYSLVFLILLEKKDLQLLHKIC